MRSIVFFYSSRTETQSVIGLSEIKVSFLHPVRFTWLQKLENTTLLALVETTQRHLLRHKLTAFKKEKKARNLGKTVYKYSNTAGLENRFHIHF